MSPPRGLLRVSLLLLLLCSLTPFVKGDDFWYRDFNTTTGLRFNGVAGTSSCDDGGNYFYSLVHGINDDNFDALLDPVLGDGGGPAEAVTTASTIGAGSTADVSKYSAVFPHRLTSGTGAPAGGCPVRLRCVRRDGECKLASLESAVAMRRLLQKWGQLAGGGLRRTRALLSVRPAWDRYSGAAINHYEPASYEPCAFQGLDHHVGASRPLAGLLLRLAPALSS